MKRFCILELLLAFPVLAGAADMNLTPSPDSSMVAFTRDSDLWVRRISDGTETRLTFDGTSLILNGYASWVYYEEILGRASRYKAFWWSPDSKSIGFYRFDNSGVGLFPIWSPFGTYGSLNETRYPKAGTTNPSVRVGIAAADGSGITWCRFPEGDDGYFGIPFWSPDSRAFYVSSMGRRQNALELWRAEASDGSLKKIYHEEYSTWVDWIDEVIFCDGGLYMVRCFESGWQQIYFLSYDGSVFKRLTDGKNWDIRLLRADEGKGSLWFSAKRDSRLHPSVYRLDRKGRVTQITDPAFWASGVHFTDGGKRIEASLSTAAEPPVKVSCDAFGGWRKSCMVTGKAEEAPSERPVPVPVCIHNDGFELYGLITYPEHFDSTRIYPVIMCVYGGPGTPYVRDYWGSRDATDHWCWENGFIYLVADPRSSGENGRRGLDEAFRRMTVTELGDYLAWARWLRSKPYTGKIGVEGFSFGGTSTAMLVLRYPEWFCCGIAGGGVYDWTLYDSHYTERFMETPQANPEGYAEASVLTYITPETAASCGRLKLTHGTGDDNVHLQNTLLLADALQKAGVMFDMMLYPDGMHGYRGAQKAHSAASDAEFWNTWLR